MKYTEELLSPLVGTVVPLGVAFSESTIDILQEVQQKMLLEL